MNFTLRLHTASDFDALYALDRACYPPGIAYTKNMLRWFLRVRGAICLVAENAGGIQGFILAEAEPPEGHIITLDVAEHVRRQGLGTALINAAENNLRACGVTIIELETATDNAAGVAFWTRHGYRTVGTIPRYYLDRVDALLMQKKLEPPKET